MVISFGIVHENTQKLTNISYLSYLKYKCHQYLKVFKIQMKIPGLANTCI